MSSSTPSVHADLDFIRERLWAGRAAIMVGAGFSRNAFSTIANLEMPLWNHVMEAMAKELYPDNPTQALRKSYLALAQEFRAASGIAGLENFIRRQVPDQGAFFPGFIHKSLMSLPWTDVLTLNFDTLLERTDVVERSYTTVYKDADLVHAGRPRIIKLHGSLPAGPFIITEEDFRRYPHEHPAMVNTVRQVIIENVVVLIGFSGDDPNFKQWLGWVRDVLQGKNHPVFLCQSKDCTRSEYEMWRGYGVTPLNISLVPDSGSELPKDHPPSPGAKSIFHFFQSLGRRDDQAIDWPKSKPNDNSDMTPDWFANKRDLKGKPTEILKAVTDLWSMQRSCYPGWLIAPIDNRETLQDYTVSWEQFIFQHLALLANHDRLRLLRELNWRWERSLKSVWESHAKIIDAELKLVGRAWISENLEIFFELSCCVIRGARADMHPERFYSALQLLSPYRNQHPDLNAEILHEEIFFAIGRMDEQQASHLLSLWPENVKHPVNLLRRCGWLLEMNRQAEALEQLVSLIDGTRAQYRYRRNDLLLLSTEGWALPLHVIAVQSARDRGKKPHELNEQEQRLKQEQERSLRQEYQQRYKELRAFECAPWDRIEELRARLQIPLQPLKSWSERPAFEPGKVDRTFTSYAAPTENHSPAFQYLGLFDHLGLPFRSGTTTLFAKEGDNAAKSVEPFAPRWAWVANYRNHNTGFLKQLSRYTVYSMPDGHARFWVENALSALEQILEPSARESIVSNELIGRLQYVLKLLSVLTLHMTNPDLRQFCALLISCRNAQWFELNVTVWSGWNEAFDRAVSVLSDQQLLEWIPTLQKTAIVGEGELASTVAPIDIEPFAGIRRWLGAASFKGKFPPESNQFDLWLKTFREGSPGVRSAACQRILGAFDREVLDPGQLESFGEALWLRRDPESGLPEKTQLHPCGFLRLPEPSIGLARETFKKWLFEKAFPNVAESAKNSIQWNPTGQTFSRFLFDFENGIKNRFHENDSKVNSPRIELSEDEAGALLNRALMWWEQQKPILERLKTAPKIFNVPDPQETAKDFADAVAQVLFPYLPSSKWGLASDLVSSLEAAGYETLYARTILNLYSESDLEATSLDIREAIRSVDANRQAVGTSSLIKWAQIRTLRKEFSPSPDHAKIIAQRIHLRARPNLDRTLHFCHSILCATPNLFSQEDLRIIDEGLESLLEETILPPTPRTGEIDTFAASELLSERWRCAQLASKLLELEPTIHEQFKAAHEWKSIAANDTLPEVRLAFGR